MKWKLTSGVLFVLVLVLASVLKQVLDTLADFFKRLG